MKVLYDFQNKANAQPLYVDSKSSNIIFDNVSFQYESGKQILKGLSFEIPAGHKIGIVGGSGSGYVLL